MNNLLTNEELDYIKNTCAKYNIEGYKINNDGSIDVAGDVDLSSKSLTKLPLSFRNVSGDFYCRYNELTSLVGTPLTVGGHFYCNDNELTSLEGAPTTVGGNFYCSYNKLTSLVGGPLTVGGDFSCISNELTSLVGAPTTVGGYLYYGRNNLPNEFTNYFDSLTEEEESVFLKYQNEYDVWTPELNLNNLEGFIEDIKDGLR